MRTFLAILQGESPQQARPVVASEDPGLIRLVANELALRLGGDRDVARALRLIPPDAAGPGRPARTPESPSPIPRPRRPRGGVR